jgi:hypothetical protein
MDGFWTILCRLARQHILLTVPALSSRPSRHSQSLTTDSTPQVPWLLSHLFSMACGLRRQFQHLLGLVHNEIVAICRHSWLKSTLYIGFCRELVVEQQSKVDIEVVRRRRPRN